MAVMLYAQVDEEFEQFFLGFYVYTFLAVAPFAPSDSTFWGCLTLAECVFFMVQWKESVTKVFSSSFASVLGVTEFQCVHIIYSLLYSFDLLPLISAEKYESIIVRFILISSVILVFHVSFITGQYCETAGPQFHVLLPVLCTISLGAFSVVSFQTESDIMPEFLLHVLGYQHMTICFIYSCMIKAECFPSFMSLGMETLVFLSKLLGYVDHANYWGLLILFALIYTYDYNLIRFQISHCGTPYPSATHPSTNAKSDDDNNNLDLNIDDDDDDDVCLGSFT